LLFVLGIATQRSGALGGANRDALLAADRAFDAATADQKLDGFSSFLADNVTTLRADQPVLRGKAAMQNAWKPLFENKSISLRWQPISAELSKSRDLGYTVGSYTLTRTDEKGAAVVGTGKYLTIWRRQGDGSWKVEFDTGVPDTDPAKSTRPRVTLCDLAEHPELYAGKIVETQASVIGSDLRIDDFSGPKCQSYMRLYLAIPQDVKPAPGFDVVRDQNYQKLFDNLNRGMSVVATFEGRFDPLFTWRNHTRERVSQGREKGYGKKHQYDGRIVLYTVSDVLARRRSKL